MATKAKSAPKKLSAKSAKSAPKRAPKPAPKRAPKPAPKRAPKPAPKAAPAKKHVAAKPVAHAKVAHAKVAHAKVAPPAAKPDKKSPIMEKPSKKNALRASILKRKAALKPIAFSLDEVRAIAQTVTSKSSVPFSSKVDGKAASSKAAVLEALAKPAKPSHVKAASLADILGFNPKKARSAEAIAEQDVPEKFKRYYKLLIDLRTHLTEGIELHSEETLKRSSKDDTGDLSSYGQHMADSGTDTFDRDFALSLVSSEQEALTEIDSAIKRIHAGTYGVCEINQKPIAKERLLAVPFTRYSAEAQKDLERNRHRARTQAGLFGELGEESGGKIPSDDGGDE
jgi:RNA polymerase-binding transcription factor DksA